ncbi:MAG TPA: hypothetical protein VGB72_08160 [Acidobacteriota bacterium]
MEDSKLDFDIIFEEIEKLNKENDVKLTSEEIIEYDEIRRLREIVIEIQSPQQSFYTST